MTDRDTFIKNNREGIAICGRYYGSDAVHVGIYWNSEGEKRIFHFNDGDNIPVEDASLPKFTNYYFVEVPNFRNELLPLLAATAELVSNNQLNGFIFNRKGTCYDGGKFEYVNGAFTGKTTPEKFINCGVFAFAFLQSFGVTLIEWLTWPRIRAGSLTFLEDWLNAKSIHIPLRIHYYNKTRVVRGKHILSSPLTATQPSEFQENEPTAGVLINWLRLQPLKPEI